ncbi:MAG TPA: 16S rRNA (adenine(1518)-N(6)/adenine(1519)-N(6))-dimethyltransferase RsmA [Candidatus Moranbacteria bacterium]|nr:16S rRNA (adenine(1518)-N(6)/adenine(1519)-N(6))-dimethyltransferase RsmA [Candidatus Moranbacteria bacterium]
MEVKAKKSLGQNWLKDEEVLQRIIQDASLSGEDVVLEIGPGQGALTEKLAAACKKVVAIELDDRLVPILENKFSQNSRVEIIHGDILRINLPELIAKQGMRGRGYKVVANIPYYITAPIIRLLLETTYPPKEIYLLVQKEVAERIVASPGAMSVLAVSVQYYADARYLFTVCKESFYPVPKVESAVVKIVLNDQEESVNADGAKRFFKVVRAGFSAKRKTLANNLAASLQLDKKSIEDGLAEMGFSKAVRAQELSVQDWKKLAKKL